MLISRLTQKMVVFRFSCDKIQTNHRVGDSVTLHHPTPSDFAPTGQNPTGQWGLFFGREIGDVVDKLYLLGAWSGQAILV